MQQHSDNHVHLCTRLICGHLTNSQRPTLRRGVIRCIIMEWVDVSRSSESTCRTTKPEPQNIVLELLESLTR